MRPAINPILFFVLLLAVVWLGYFTVREDFSSVCLLYILGFGAYGLLLWRNAYRSLPMFLLFGLLLRLVLFASQPAFSDDHHRFIWDGQLVAHGVNPYAELPSTLDTSQWEGLDNTLYNKLNSKDYHSVYPPSLQYIYGICAWLSGSDRGANIKLLRLFVLVSEMLTIWLLFRLLTAWKMPVERTAIYALNPLVVVELTGNLHAEAFMICFTLLAIFLLYHGRWMLSAMAMGMAICAKLWPLLFLPFLAKRIGWGKAVGYITVVLVIITALFLPFWHNDLVVNFQSGLQLYFDHFEYNSSVYAILRYVFGASFVTQYALVPILSLLALLVLYLEDLLNKKRQTELSSWPLMMLWALAIYLLFSTTVHPWYVLPLLAFCVFSRFRWPVLWAMLLPITYITYAVDPWQQNTWLITVEYLLVAALFLAEVNSYVVWPWWSRFKAKTKSKLLLPYLKKGEKVLEVGAGNAALTVLLRESGIPVTALDVEDGSHFEDVVPVLASGISMPFEDHQFDTVQMITMLHHTSDPDALIREASRVGRRLIVLEDVYSNLVQKYLTLFMDSLANMEFKGHPHSNRTDKEWRVSFDKLGLIVVEVRHQSALLFFQQRLYLLDRKIH